MFSFFDSENRCVFFLAGDSFKPVGGSPILTPFSSLSPVIYLGILLGNYPGSRQDGAWTLWERMRAKRAGLGDPSVFNGRVDQTRWVVFTITSRGPLLANLVNEFSGNRVLGEQHLITFVDSAWFWSLHPPFQPFFKNQDMDTTVMLGYGLYANREGDYIKKTMPNCTGEELLTEVCYHFGFMRELPEILESTNVVSNLLPYATSHFQVRRKGDRPPVVLEGSTNLALLGQFVEIPVDTVFTVEYSVRSAMTAVYRLLGIRRRIPKVHRALYDAPWECLDVFRFLAR